MPPVISLPIFKSPQCVISTSPDGRLLQVHQDVLSQVEQLDGPMVVVAVAGLHRTGKSYIMNRLALGRTDAQTYNGFSLGSTIESHTKGIWLWARIHPIHQDQYILLLDTEGLGCAFKGDPNHDNWIFCLATLLCSLLCYNTKGSVDEDSLRKLNFITEMSKHIRSNTQEPDDKDFDLFFPHFAYIIRDFHLEIKRGGKEMTEDEYLEDALSLKTGSGRHEKDYNSPRLCIRKYFKQRKCFVFDFPVMDSSLLKELDNIHDNQLSQRFLKQTRLFCEYIFGHAPVKKLETGQSVTGRMWSSLLSTYVETIRSGRVPCIENAVRSMAMIENTRLLEECAEMYNMKMLSDLSMPTRDEQILAARHFAVLKEVVAAFLKRVIFDDNQDFQKQLNERMLAMYEDYKRQNEQASLQLCKDVLAELEQPYKQKMADGVYTCTGGYTVYKDDMNRVKDAYSKLDYLGVMKKEVLLEFLETKWKEGEVILATDNKVTEEQRKVEMAQAAAVEAERQREEAERAVAKAERQAAEKEQAMKENIKQLEVKLETEMANEREHHIQILNSRLEEQARLMQEGFDGTAGELKAQISNLQRRISEPARSSGGCIIL